MKIKQLDIAGFRSLKNVSWQPGDLNVVIGPNGSGKSNLLRALELLSASTQGSLSKHILSAGGMGAILWDGRASSIWINLKLANPTFDYELNLARLGSTSGYSIEGESLFDSNQTSQFTNRTSTSTRSNETWLSTELSFSNLFPEDSEELLDLIKLKGITTYHDLDVSKKSQIRQPSVARNERFVEADGQNLIPVLHTLYTENRDFEWNIDAAMRAAFGSDYEKLVFTPDAGDQRVQMKVRWRSLQRAQSTADLSDGTLRFLLLMTILSAPDPPMLIAIDEPETGLHPSMFPIIAEYAVEASSRTQVVFTTHSPQFLDAFTDIKPTTTVARWENGETFLHTLKGEQLNYWLAEYSLGTLFHDGDLEAIA